jgi:hypothetical protein
MIGADDGEALRLRLVDAPASFDLREVVDGRDFVALSGLRRAVAAGDGFQCVGSGFPARRSSQSEVGSPTCRSSNQQAAAFVRRIAPRVRDDGGQRLAVDADLRQQEPR